ncbi:GerAB/ArcD/ProY family transporter [Ectobacillus sp. sgz5001026]|uniref:GerAB/ArcD/ProY family transporter n=1 Tax=Ectobacillus sp. sgz5001026 TaxID=3242473 RepID=UPI0036D2A94A
MDKEKISPFQLFCLMYLFELGSSIVVGVGLQAKQDAWLAILLGMMSGLVLFLIYSYLFFRFPNQTLIGYIPKLVGKYIGIPLSFIYVLYFLYIAARVLRDFGDLLITSTLRQTPLLVVNGLMILLISFGIAKGIEGIGRTSELVFLLISLLGFIGIIVIVFSGIVKIENLLPFFENGWKPILSTVFKQTYTFPFGEMVVFTMILPYLNKPHLGRRVGLFAMLASGIVLSVTIAIEISILGPIAVAANQFPLLETISRVNIANFIQRLDVIVVATLILGVFIKIMIFFYAGFVGVVEIFHLTKKNHITYCILALSVLILISSIKIASNFTEHIQIGLKWVPLYLHLPLQTGVPLILFIIALIRKVT